MTQLLWARNTLLFSWCVAGILPGALPTPPLRAQTTITQLKTRFEHPPDDSRPMMRWWWFGIAAEKPEIRRELEQMKADGIGGAELAFVYPQTLKGNEPFLSKPMLESVRYAESEARRLGLRLDVTLGSGWPYGGPATTLDQAAWRLRTVNVQSNMTAKAPPRVLLAKGETVISRTTTQTFLASHTGQKVKRASVG